MNSCVMDKLLRLLMLIKCSYAVQLLDHAKAYVTFIVHLVVVFAALSRNCM